VEYGNARLATSDKRALANIGSIFVSICKVTNIRAIKDRVDRSKDVLRGIKGIPKTELKGEARSHQVMCVPRI